MYMHIHNRYYKRIHPRTKKYTTINKHKYYDTTSAVVSTADNVLNTWGTKDVLKRSVTVIRGLNIFFIYDNFQTNR